MSDPQTLFDLRESIATITLNRPERVNAWTAQMGAKLFEHLLRCDEDDSVRAIVVTGAGKAFCAGADLERGGETLRARVTEAPGARFNRGKCANPSLRRSTALRSASD